MIEIVKTPSRYRLDLNGCSHCWTNTLEDAIAIAFSSCGMESVRELAYIDLPDGAQWSIDDWGRSTAGGLYHRPSGRAWDCYGAPIP